MDEDWRNAFGILMCAAICGGASAGICDGAPSTGSSFYLLLLYKAARICCVISENQT